MRARTGEPHGYEPKERHDALPDSDLITTVTLDSSRGRIVRQRMIGRRVSVKQALNDLICEGQAADVSAFIGSTDPTTPSYPRGW